MVSSGSVSGEVVVAMVSILALGFNSVTLVAFAPKARPPVRLAPAGDGGGYGERVGGGDAGGLFCGEIWYVLVLHIKVNKGAEFPLASEKVIAELGMGVGERSEGLGNCGGLDLDRSLVGCIRAQRGGDVDGHGDVSRPFRLQLFR